jgi:hypothetical protein
VAAKPSVPNTVHGLASLTAPTVLELNRASDERFHPERLVYRVSAFVIGAKFEADRDYQIVIGDRDGTAVTMLAEIPAGTCVSLGRAKSFDNLRRFFSQAFIDPRPAELQKLATPAPACITGIGFFDFPHRQKGEAGNSIELHPVLAIEKGFCQ